MFFRSVKAAENKKIKAGRITSNWSRRGYCHGLCWELGEEEQNLKAKALIYESYGIIQKGKSTNHASERHAAQLNVIRIKGIK